MKRQMLSIVLALICLISMLPVSALAQEEKSLDADAQYAVEMGLVSPDYLDNPSTIVRSTELREMLVKLIADQVPNKLEYFESKVTTMSELITRGKAVVMLYYAAVCLEADHYNNDFDHRLAEADGKFWEVGGGDPTTLFPDCRKDLPVSVNGQVWNNEFTAAYLWNVWHTSPLSDKQIVPYDKEAQGMRHKSPMKREEAASAVARLYASSNVSRFVPSESAEARTLPSDLFTPELLAKTAAHDGETMDDMPRLTGFVFDDDRTYSRHMIVSTPKEIENIAEWGFTTARLRITYETLFSSDGSTINLTQLEKLDRLVAAAIEHDVHFSLLFSTLPGRTKWVDHSTGESGGTFDMFTNKKRQAEAALVWETLAARYAPVSGAHLSFVPFWEPTNRGLSSGDTSAKYSFKNICSALVKLIDAIRTQDPGRYIIYEASPANDAELTIKESKLAYETVQKKYENARISFNFCQNAYVYAEMTDAEGEDIDNNNHSMFKPEYPVTIYKAKQTISKGKPITLNGCLPAGTVIRLHIERTRKNGSLTITADGEELYKAKLKDKRYKVSGHLSRHYPFATSEECISVTLEKDAESVVIATSGGTVTWAGMEVILPDSYLQERWYYFSSYDEILTGEEYYLPFELRKTSTVMICPNDEKDGRNLTIHEDLTYSSEEVFREATAETIQQWGEEMAAFAPGALVRFENACFSLGTTQRSAIAYYEDVLSMMDACGFGWLSNDYEIIRGNSYGRIAGAQVTEYDGYEQFNLPLLQVLQKHQ